MKVYIVTRGEYSDYEIDRVFLNKENALKYIETSRKSFREPHLEEYEISDDDELKPFNFVDVEYKLNNDIENYYFRIEQTNSLESNYSEFDSTFYNNYSGCILTLKRKISTANFDEDQLKNKYLKVCRDMMAKIKYMKEVEGLDKTQIRRWVYDNYN